MASPVLTYDLFDLDEYNDMLFPETPASDDADFSLLQPSFCLSELSSSEIDFIDWPNPDHIWNGISPHDLPHVDSSSQNTISLSSNSALDTDVQSKPRNAQTSTSSVYDGHMDDLRKCGDTTEMDALQVPEKHRQRSTDGGRHVPFKKQRRSTVNVTKQTENQKIIIQVRSQEELEDGYRWRKYGEKPMKNSNAPRRYYKCSDKKCSVKKRVERHSSNSEILVVTYEGIHNHKCPNPVYYVEKHVYIPISTSAASQ